MKDRSIDPCCGFGRIPTAARAAGLEAYGMDLIDRGFEYLAVCDFLQSDIRADNYVMNPPFELADQFALRALRLASRKVAMVYPTRRLNAAGQWLRKTPLYRTWYLTPRPSMPPGFVVKDMEAKGQKPSGGKQDFCILVWLIGFDGDATIRWLHRDGKPRSSVMTKLKARPSSRSPTASASRVGSMWGLGATFVLMQIRIDPRETNSVDLRPIISSQAA